MSIATAITNLQSRVADAYDAVEAKGGTLPQVQNTTNLPTAISSIPQSGGGSTKWGMSIDDVCYTDGNGVLKMFGGASGAITFTGVTTIDAPCSFFSAFTSGVTSVSFPDLTTISGSSSGTFGTTDGIFGMMCKDNSSLTSISFPELVTIGPYTRDIFRQAFWGCTGLTSVSFPKLATIGTSDNGCFSQAFYNCTNLTSVSFPELTTIAVQSSGTTSFGSAFIGCTSLTSVSFPKLSTINGTGVFNSAFGQGSSASPASGVTTLSFPALTSIVSNATTAGSAIFYNNKALTRMDFPVLASMKKTATATTDNLTYIFDNCTALAELHFGQANQEVIEASSGYATKWGAPSTCTIYFDL